MTPAIIGTIVAAVIVVILVIVYFVRRKNADKPAKVVDYRSFGSKKIASALKSFARSNSFVYIAPARMKTKSGIADMNALAIGPFGVVGVIGMGYFGDVYGRAEDKIWVSLTPSKIRTEFQNPVTEASACVRVIRDALFAKGIKMVPVEVLPVFTTDELQIGVPKGTGHYSWKEFKSYLKKDRFKKEEKNMKIDVVEAAIREALLPEEEA